MINNDYKFWQRKAEEWIELADTYVANNDTEGMDRCLARADVCLLHRDEASGIHYVVSGRKGFGKTTEETWGLCNGLKPTYAGRKSRTVVV